MSTPIIWDIDFRPHVRDIEDQQMEGSCVAGAVTNYLELLSEPAGAWLDLSRQFPYYYTRAFEGNLAGEGCNVEHMLTLGQTLGFCLESQWPYIASNENVQPPQSVYQSGAARLITGWQKVPLSSVNVWASVAAIDKALSLGFPVLFTTALYNGYRNVIGPLEDQFYDQTGAYIGLHEQVIVGKSDTSSKYLVLNDWGTGWGEAGYAAVPKSAMVSCNGAYVIYGFNGISLPKPFQNGEVMTTTIKLYGTTNSSGEIAFSHNTPNLMVNLLRADGFSTGAIWGEQKKMNFDFCDANMIKFINGVPNAPCHISFEY